MEFNVETLASISKGSIASFIIAEQCKEMGISHEKLLKKMADHLQIMKESISDGLNPNLKSVSGLTGGQAYKLFAHRHRAAMGKLAGKATAYALAVAESNAAMGKIVAAPTAGACGILPGCLVAFQEVNGIEDEDIVNALFTAAAFGHVIATNASISGAEGGCQAECGSAAAMTAAALVELQGGTPRMAASACAFALMNTMGLVCDPVGGLVEIPCVYRNVGGVGNAFTAADMALSGIESPLPCDEVILAMKDVGDAMPTSLRETGEGGCAACASAKKRVI